MAAFLILVPIVGYTAFIIYKKSRDFKEGKSCCGGCASCPYKGKCKE